MGMKVKAVIVRPDRTNDVIVVKKKNVIGNTFKHDNCLYTIDPNCAQTTWNRKWYRMWQPQYYSTFYYIRGFANPIPFADMIRRSKTVKATLQAKNGKKKDGEPQEEVSLTVAEYKDIVDLGVPSEELSALFTPWFYRVIAAPVRDVWEQLDFMISVGTLFGVIYTAWQVSQGQSA